MSKAVDQFGEETMTTVTVYGRIKHNGKWYDPGETIKEISVKDAERLKEQGLLDGELYQASEEKRRIIRLELENKNLLNTLASKNIEIEKLKAKLGGKY